MHGQMRYKYLKCEIIFYLPFIKSLPSLFPLLKTHKTSFQDLDTQAIFSVVQVSLTMLLIPNILLHKLTVGPDDSIIVNSFEGYWLGTHNGGDKLQCLVPKTDPPNSLI